MKKIEVIQSFIASKNCLEKLKLFASRISLKNKLKQIKVLKLQKLALKNGKFWEPIRSTKHLEILQSFIARFKKLEVYASRFSL